MSDRAGGYRLQTRRSARSPRPARRWLKLKCLGREEFIVIGYSPPSGSRVGIGGLQLGYRDAEGNLHYTGGVGTGYDEAELRRLRDRLEPMRVPAPEGLLIAGDPIEGSTVWVRPELVAEVKFTGWAGFGRIRHAVYLGLREDKPAAEVVREVADPDAPRRQYRPRPGGGGRKSWHAVVPPRRRTR